MNESTQNPKAPLLERLSVLLFGSTIYVCFLLVFLAVVAFVSGVLLPKTIDSGNEAGLGEALLVNGSILALFAVQHTIMARIWFKRWWTGIVHPALERSIFVLATLAILVLLMWQWRAVPDVVWSVESPVLAGVLWTVCGGGWLLVLVATFLIDHFELFGLSQVIAHFRGRQAASPAFQVRSLYRYTRHPLYLGFLIAFWVTPHMTVGHLMFAAIVTGYLAIGMRIEERTLVAIHGDDYREYRRHVPMLLPVGAKEIAPERDVVAGA